MGTAQPNDPVNDSSDEKQDPHRDTDIPHSLALLPADLEVALPFPGDDKEVYIEEKQPVQACKESCRSATEAASEKELLETPVFPDGWYAP